MFTLKDTIDDMASDDYNRHFCAEYAQVQSRLSSLERTVKLLDDGDLDFIPKCPRATYNFQLKAMREYRDILEVRASIENIDLEAYLDKIDSANAGK